MNRLYCFLHKLTDYAIRYTVHDVLVHDLKIIVSGIKITCG